MVNENWKISQNYKDTCIELLSENLASFRAKAGITQAELANLIGISRQTYNAIESGQRVMSWNTYLSLLLFFDTKASPHNCVCGLRPIFCPIRAVIKGGNTYSIPALL